MKIEHWLATLPDGYRERALRAHNDPYSGCGEGRSSTSLSNAINSGMCWARSSEGGAFWDLVYEHFRFRESRTYIYTPLPPLPTTNPTRKR